jgi:hypothetical protein
MRATILFGGILWRGSGRLLSDTWELKDGVWSQVDVSPAPSARHRGAMVYDNRRGYSILFGGQGSWNRLLGDTWTYADGSWRRVPSGWWHRPAGRCGHSFAFDEKAGVAVLFGGIGFFGQSLGDTWILEDESWRRISGPGPKPRRYAAFAYDPHLKGCVLHGGAADDLGKKCFGDAWLFRDETWTRLADDFATDKRDDHGLAYHRGARMLIMLEGVAGERGVLGRTRDGWKSLEVNPLHPRHQCSPLVWDEPFDGLVLHGGEACHAGPQFDSTLVLRLVEQEAAEG